MRKGSKWIGILIALLLAAEIALRVVLGLGHPLLIEPNPAYGYMPAPSQDLHRFFSHIHINAYGMRSGDITQAKPANTKRVLFLGDSVTFGTTYVDQDKIFTSLIQGELQKHPADPVQILNASAGGWAPANELGFLQAKGTFGAGLIVFVLNTKDLAQPFAGFDENALNPTRNPPTAISELLSRYVAPRIFKGLAVRDPGSVAEGDPTIEQDTPKVLETLSQAHRIATANGARFAIIFSPSVGEDVAAYRQHWDKGASMLMAWAKGEGVDVLDMTQEYSRHAAREVYFDGIHLKPFGHELIEKEFFERFGANP